MVSDFLTNQTNQLKPTSGEIFQLNVLRPIWMKFCIGALVGLLPCSCSNPTSALLLPCPAFSHPGPAPAKALLLPCFCYWPPQFGSLHQHQHLTNLFRQGDKVSANKPIHADRQCSVTKKRLIYCYCLPSQANPTIVGVRLGTALMWWSGENIAVFILEMK